MALIPQQPSNVPPPPDPAGVTPALQAPQPAGPTPSTGNPEIVAPAGPAQPHAADRYSNIPAQMQALAQWAVSEADKAPKQVNKLSASSTDPTTWTGFADACGHAKQNKFDIGFMLTAASGIAAIDIDIKDKTPPEWIDRFDKILKAAEGTYIERSRSGKGYHIIGFGTLPNNKGRRRDGVEIYTDARYMIQTGDSVTTPPAPLADIQYLIDMLIAQMPVAANNEDDDEPLDVPETKSLDEIHAELSGNSNGQKYLDYFNGDWQKYFKGQSDESQSAADLGLMQFFIFGGATNQQVIQMFKASALDPAKRPADKRKSKPDNYIRRTLRKARNLIAHDKEMAALGELTAKRMLEKQGFKTTSEPEAPVVAVDLFKTLEPPPFNLELVPSIIANYARDESEISGIDPVAIAIPCVVACAAAIDNRIKIQPKRHVTNWTEPAILWGAILGDPSTMKTHGINCALSKTREINFADIVENEREEKEWRHNCEVIKANGGITPDKPLIKRATINDVTVEKAADLLSQCEPRGILLEKDELNGWLESMDAYKGKSNSGDRAFWLEGYNGGSRSVDRLGRGTIAVKHIGISVIGGIQVEVLRSFSNASNHDGMLPRMMIFSCRDSQQGTDRPNNHALKEKYEDLIRWLYQLQGPIDDGRVRLSEEAHKVREVVSEKIHKISNLFPNKFVKASVGKWQGLYVRLMLVYHCVDCYSSNVHPLSTLVSEANAVKVSRLLFDQLLPSTIKFYSTFDTAEDKARDIAALILAKGWTRFTEKRDLAQAMTASRSWKDYEKAEALNRLEAYGWIVPETAHRNNSGRPTAYLVNASVHDRFTTYAEKERKRREEVTKLMNDIGGGNG
jgi:hypothetical protein